MYLPKRTQNQGQNGAENLQSGEVPGRQTGVQPEVFVGKLAPQVGLEPTTRALTVRCSTIELLRNVKVKSAGFYIGEMPSFVNSARA